MKISDFKWMTKRNGIDRTENAGGQIVLDFGKYHLSIIDDGYGRDRGLFEIGLFSAADGVANAMTSLPGITAEDDTVKGNLTESDVNCIIQKLYALTRKAPEQI
jgi:hypothetical protein